ncbi:hypothetical protein MVES_003368 [Malassezia vespertilionis]|uniref:Uncharacterized protein n=1 Tax=Malassezia vespertilionis TaxID=2020962 RepID=A0A2N1J7N6_9BASI|nr:hypothetical protein MVES_003368 [Malassezia vespertilionis]
MADAPLPVSFIVSGPVQILVIGIVLAMSAVLFVQLIFTGPYHYQLNKVNFIFQILSSFLFFALMAVIAALALNYDKQYGTTYPYVFPFTLDPLIKIGEDRPVVQRVFASILPALAMITGHFTHIQFLTLLFPSALEARLIYWMLGPLAIIEAGMYFSQLANTHVVKVRDLGDAIESVCESTLSLLYMFALTFWGVFVCGRRAWRTDGATTMFGSAALTLALFKTVVSFIHIAYDRIDWILFISWALTIWQSWLGFWWWVSAGMARMRKRHLQKRLTQEEQHVDTASRRWFDVLAFRRKRGTDPESFVMDEAVLSEESAETPLSPRESTVDTSTLYLEPWIVRFGNVLERYQPSMMRRRMERLRAAHAQAAEHAAREQALAYAQVQHRMQFFSKNHVLQLNKLMQRMAEGKRESRLQDRTSYE